jgi:hypothetical protein
MNLKTVLGWLAVAFIVLLCIASPHAPVDAAHEIGNFLTSAAHGISDFFASL